MKHTFIKFVIYLDLKINAMLLVLPKTGNDLKRTETTYNKQETTWNDVKQPTTSKKRPEVTWNDLQQARNDLKWHETTYNEQETTWNDNISLWET